MRALSGLPWRAGLGDAMRVSSWSPSRRRPDVAAGCCGSSRPCSCATDADGDGEPGERAPAATTGELRGDGDDMRTSPLTERAGDANDERRLRIELVDEEGEAMASSSSACAGETRLAPGAAGDEWRSLAGVGGPPSSLSCDDDCAEAEAETEAGLALRLRLRALPCSRSSLSGSSPTTTTSASPSSSRSSSCARSCALAPPSSSPTGIGLVAVKSAYRWYSLLPSASSSSRASWLWPGRRAYSVAVRGSAACAGGEKLDERKKAGPRVQVERGCCGLALGRPAGVGPAAAAAADDEGAVRGEGERDWLRACADEGDGTTRLVRWSRFLLGDTKLSCGRCGECDEPPERRIGEMAGEGERYAERKRRLDGVEVEVVVEARAAVDGPGTGVLRLGARKASSVTSSSSLTPASTSSRHSLLAGLPRADSPPSSPSWLAPGDGDGGGELPRRTGHCESNSPVVLGDSGG